MKELIYQLLPRLWGPANTASDGCSDATSGHFSHVDEATLRYLGSLGITHLWVTGVLRHATRSRIGGFPPSSSQFVKGEAGSPYAITDYYDVNPYLADNPARRMEEFDAMLKKKSSQTEVVKQRLKACPYIKGIDVDEDFISGSFPIKLADGSNIDALYITGGAARMYDLQLIEGVFPDDSLSMEDYACVANEAAIKALGIKNRETDLVQFAERIFWTAANEKDNPPYRIVGVVRDFIIGRQSEPIHPLLLMFSTWQKDYLFDARQMEGRNYLLDVAEGHEEDIIRELKDIEKELFGTTELKYQWVEDQRQELYKEDQRTARIFVTFSLLAIAVTCLGVLGLMMFDVRRRFREIALRKVNGATFRDIALLLSRRYLIIFGVATVASLPVSLLVIHRLMASYTIRTSFAWWIPLLSIAIILVLCALTLWQQVWKATRIKPYIVLKEN